AGFVCEAGDVSWRNGLLDPRRIGATFGRRGDLPMLADDCVESAQTLARERLSDGITDAEESVPCPVLVRVETLLHFRVRDKGEVDHGVRGEQVEVRNRLVCASDEAVDLIRLGGEERVVARECRLVGYAGATRRLLERRRDSFDAAKSPGDSSREERIDEGVGVRQHRPPFATRARESMLNLWDVPERKPRARAGE